MKPLHIRQAEKIVTDWEREKRRALKASRPAKVATGGGKLSGEAGSPTARRQFPPRVHTEVILRQGGRCASCDGTLYEHAYDIDHIVPLELTGANHPSNLQALCITCHKLKTREDIARISKARRLAKKHFEGRKPSRMKSRGFS